MSSSPRNLTDVLAAQIASAGPISVHDFMESCLQHPEFGYYAGRERDGGGAIGAAGDFVTAPEISQVFGELLGVWCMVVWEQIGAPDRLRLIELGPGRGTLMADLLRVGRLRPQFLNAVEVVLVEASPTLEGRQRERLAESGVEVTWCASAADVPREDVATIVLGNEFLDALPVRQFVRRSGVWMERGVDLVEGAGDGEDAFQFVELAAAGLDLELPGDGGEGAICEVRPAVDALMGDLSALTERSPLAMLFVDYGYAEPKVGDSLQAVFRHAPVSVFHRPGETDLTAHVDFSAVQAAARRNRLDALACVPQARFLAQLGIVERMQQLLKDADATTVAREQLAAARLVSPDAMGSLFKVVGFSKGINTALPTFEQTAKG